MAIGGVVGMQCCSLGAEFESVESGTVGLCAIRSCAGEFCAREFAGARFLGDAGNEADHGA